MADQANIPHDGSPRKADRDDQGPIRVLAAVIRRDSRWLVCRRPPHKRHGGFWEFPGGKLEPGESLLDAARREMREELGLDALAVGRTLAAIRDPGSRFLIEFVEVEIAEGAEPQPLEHAELRWATRSEALALELAPSDRTFVEGEGVDLIARAVAIAAEAHRGQRDKAGRPYILHPLRVMMAVAGDEAMMAAALHDVVEDGPGWSLDRLREEGIPEPVVSAVEALTKRSEEEGSDAGYFAFVRRAATNPIARAVKLADLRDNLDQTRLQSPTARDEARMRRYREAVRIIESG